MREGGDSIRTRVGYVFRLSTSRAATDEELEILLAEFADRQREFLANRESAQAYLAGGGESKPDPNMDTADLAALAAVASLILNLDESISRS